MFIDRHKDVAAIGDVDPFFLRLPGDRNRQILEAVYGTAAYTSSITVRNIVSD